MSAIYARIAKFAVIMIMIMCALSFLTLTIMKAGEIHDFAARVFIFAVLPSMSLAKFFLGDPVENTLREYQFETNAELRKAIQPLLDTVDANVRVGIYDSEEINAFAISSLMGRSAAIGFSAALVRRAGYEELYAIAAHEVAHVKNGDSKNKLYILAFHDTLEFFPHLFATFAKSLLVSFKWAICIVAVFMALLAYVSGVDIREAHLENILWPFFQIGWPALAAIVGAWVLRHILQHAFLAYSRGRELVADVEAARLTSPEMVMRALNFLPDDERDGHGFFDSHPPLAERKRRVEKLKSLKNHRVKD